MITGNVEELTLQSLQLPCKKTCSGPCDESMIDL